MPNPQQENSEAVLDDIEGYFRHLRLKELFLDEDDEEEESNNAATQLQFLPLCPQRRGTVLMLRTVQFMNGLLRHQTNVPFVNRLIYSSYRS